MHQERTIQELNDMVYRQEQALARLQLEVLQLRQQLMTATPSLNRTEEEETPPPHY
jgi:SlyX protein